MRNGGVRNRLGGLINAIPFALLLGFIFGCINIASSKTAKLDSDNPKYCPRIFMIGDSIMLGASKALKRVFPNAYIDAKGSRQLKQAEKVIEDNIDKIRHSQIVVIGLGTNGRFKKQDLERIIDKIGEDKKIFLITIQVNASWRDESNRIIYQVAKERPNVEIIDWYRVSKGRMDLFAKDKIHLSRKGIEVYTNLIREAIEREEEKYSGR